jgi:23S rRNA pseudouridine1911/1915/1917 synthase
VPQDLQQTPFLRRSQTDPANFVVDTAFSVIHEDDDILVLDKPAPLAVHPVGAYAELNLHSLLKKDPRWSGSDVRFVHRLDAETSGVICAAKNAAAARFLGIEFLNGWVEKKYRALVFGTPPHSEGIISYRLGNDLSSGFQTVRVRDDRNGEEAVTRYRLIYTTGQYSYLELSPMTGRTHQIRAHLSLLGNPIVGDKIYNDLNIFREYVMFGLKPEMLERIKLPRLALHAASLGFRHPGDQGFVEFTSKPPDFILQVQK